MECYSPRTCFEGLLKEGILSPEDEEIAGEIIRLRNLLVHVYDEETAKALYHKIKEGPFLEFFNKVYENFKEKLKKIYDF